MQIDNLKIYRSIVITCISICMVLLLFVPMYAFWIPEAFEEGQIAGWNDVVMYNDELFQIIIPPFYILFPLALVIKSKLIKLALKLLLFLNGLILLFVGMMSGILAQDYSVGHGTIILLGMAGLLGIMFLIDWFIAYERKGNKNVT